MNEGRRKSEEVLVSIIIGTFNAAKHLRACLVSIISQAETDVEIIIVDAKSNDDTISIVNELNPGNIIFISEPDKGIYDALNKGVALAQGKWLYFMGSDDKLLPGFSEIARKLKNKATIYYGNSEPFYDSDNKPPYELLTGKFSKYRLAKYCINHQAILYPAMAFDKYRYSLKYKVFADYALNLQLWGDRHFKKEFYPVLIARYNMTGFSSTINDVAFKKDKPRMIRQSMGWLIYLRFIFKRFKKRLKGETGFD